MNILHIWDIAGVACLLSRELRKLGHQSKVIRHAGYDEFGIYKFYEDCVLPVNSKIFEKKCLEEAESADVVHFHAKPEIFLKISKKFGKTKKLIFHYHGSDIRGFKTKENVSHAPSLSNTFHNPMKTVRYILKPWKKLNEEVQSIADSILVSSSDLLDDVPSAHYLPNPIDIEHFKPQNDSKNEKKEALTIKTHLTNTEWALDYCKKNNINLNIEVHDRKKFPVNYNKMPDLFGKYQVYVDIRYINGLLLTQQSATSLQALACGLKVLDHELKYRTSLPQEHHPSNVISKLISIYSGN